MRLPYTHEYGRFMHKFKNTACYTQLNSAILAANRCANYYGPRDGEYTSHWQYQPRSKCKCNNKQLCDAIRQDLYVATTKSSCLIPDEATAWYKEQKQKRKLKQAISSMTPQEMLTYRCRYYEQFKFQSPPAKCLDLKVPIRSVPCLPFQVSSETKRISPEFLELLKQHDNRQREKSVLTCLPPAYTRRRVKPAQPMEELHYCLDGRPCYCGSSQHVTTERLKSDTHMDRYRSQKKGLLAKWCFCSQPQVYPAEDDDYYCRQGSQRSLKHYARSQPRILTHEQCPPEPCTEETCPLSCKKAAAAQKSSTKFVKPRAHGYVTGTDAESELERLENYTDLRPHLHQPLESKNSITEIWTKPNATQMRESRSSLRPRYSVPWVKQKDMEPPKDEKCLNKPKTPPTMPSKPKSYVLGKWPETEMTKTLRRPTKPAYCMRAEKSITNLTPRHRIQEECPYIEEERAEDKTCYPRLRPRYIPQGSQADRYDNPCWRRNRMPKEDPKPKWVNRPKTQPEFHDDKPTCQQLKRRRPRQASQHFTETRPRFHELSSDTSGRRFRGRGILKKPSRVMSHNSAYESDGGSPPLTSKQANYRNKRKPNADETSDEEMQLPRVRTPELRGTLPPIYDAKETKSKLIKRLSCLSFKKSKKSEYIQSGKCKIPLRTPAPPKYKAPVHILKGHETCFMESSYWAGIPNNYPQPYLDKAIKNQKEIDITKRQRVRMWGYKECPQPKYAPASKCQKSLKQRCPSNEPHKALYTPKKRLTTRDASPYHRKCYKSSSGAESECTFLGRPLKR